MLDASMGLLSLLLIIFYGLLSVFTVWSNSWTGSSDTVSHNCATSEYADLEDSSRAKLNFVVKSETWNLLINFH